MMELLMFTALFGVTLWPLLTSRQVPAHIRMVEPKRPQRERHR